MKALIMPNLSKERANECVIEVVKTLNSLGAVAMIENEHQQTFNTLNAEFGEFSALLSDCDCILSIGGDGTLIHSAKKTIGAGKPLLGINVGRLGFLSQIEYNNLSNLKNLVEEKYRIEKRMLLEVEVVSEQGSRVQYALNDVVISRSAFARIVDLEVSCNEKPIINYRADGVIFATPTGSTAYSLSAGGSIIDPKIDTIILTPISPHSLFDRSIVFSPDKVIKVRSQQINNSAEVYISVDGETEFAFSSTAYALIRKSDIYVQFIAFDDRDFYDILNQKFMLRG